MDIDDLPLTEQIKTYFHDWGYGELWPPQKKAIEEGVLEGHNTVLAIPTASGKTLIALLAMVKSIVEGRGKALYLCPLRALAQEKFQEFKTLEEKGIRVAISTGDFDRIDHRLGNYDLIICTNEKADSLLRHQPSWLHSISVVVSDEVHLINDKNRGPTLEVALAKLREINPNAQILALSATVKNAEEIADWLGAKLVVSNWRPVELVEGVYHRGEFEDKTGNIKKLDSMNSEPVINITQNTLQNEKGQVLIFVGSRRAAQSQALQIGTAIYPKLSQPLKRTLESLSNKILQSGEVTRLSKLLAQVVSKGAAFHHAGLSQIHRKIVEDSFRSNLVKVICSTPTLCLSGDSYIWNDMEELKISESISNASCIALKGEELVKIKIQEILKNHNFSKLLEIKSQLGFSIKVTPKHRMIIKRDRKKLLLPAEEIKKGDRIATIGKISLNDFSTPLVNDFILDNKNPSQNFRFDPDICYFLGLMLGDGYSGAEISDNEIRYKGEPQIVNTDEEILETAKRFGKRFQIDPREKRNSYGTPFIVFSKTKWFREFLVRSGVDLGEEKHIAKPLMSMNEENEKSLLRGLFDSDGFINRGRNIGFSNTSETLVKQIQKQLLRFNIVSGIRKRKGSVMDITGKEYNTKPHYELLIQNKECILRFHNLVGFGIQRKKTYLDELVSHIQKNILYFSCPSCNYKIYRGLFSGRTNRQKEWGHQKVEIINLLALEGELSSNAIRKRIGFIPRLKEKRLNHHYELIQKRKQWYPSIDWLWRLNDIGQWIYENILSKEKEFSTFFKLEKCPLCNNILERVLKKGWRCTDLDGALYWDFVKDIQKVPAEESVYDVVLPNNPTNDHMFVSNGFIVHNSAGVNLPAKTAIIRDYKRYEGGIGSYPIPVLEYKQMCFPKGTIIETLDGKKNIENIQIGEKIVTYNPKKKKFSIPSVLKLFTRESIDLIAITIEGGKKIVSTFDHPFYSKKGWVEGDIIKKGDYLALLPQSVGDLSRRDTSSKKSRRKKTDQEYSISSLSFRKVIDNQRISKKKTVYNLEVEEPNTFFANGFLVHNCGRAGRPKYDKTGTSVLIAKTNEEKEFLLKRYVRGKPEKIWSKLASEPALRTHVLAAIATKHALTQKGLRQFISKTFYAFQYDQDDISYILDNVMEFLIHEGLIVPHGQDLSATEFGKKVSDLYLDPLGAVSLREAILKSEDKIGDILPVGIFQAISHTPDMQQLYLRRKESEGLHVFVTDNEDEFLLEVPDQWEDPADYEFFLSEIKTSKLCLDWIEEFTEDNIHERYNIGSGDIHRIISTADWLLYSMGELSKLFKTKKIQKTIQQLRLRIIHGCKKELLPLVEIKGIGRVRGRILFNRGIKTPSELVQADPKTLVKLPTFGPDLVKTLLTELGQHLDPEEWVRLKKSKPDEGTQSTLDKY
ncbi:MAG: DEAD/DEAH box helicase [Candidatus Ranarchaeia archaeon]